jgi:hypothetical protein
VFEILTKYHADYILFDPATIEPALLRSYHPSTYRWPMIESYITEHLPLYANHNVILCDVRDMVFQADPFGIVEVDKPGLYVFNGVESITIGNDGWNGPWIKDCWGGDIYNNLTGDQIICSGVTIGSSDAIQFYLNSMSEAMLTDRFKQCERNGVDQGVHNVLTQLNSPNYLTQVPGGIRRFTQSEGLVCNLQAGVMTVGDDYIVRNRKGQVVPVVHQYDRDEKLMNDLFKKYVYWDMATQSDGEGSCDGFNLKDNTEAFKGRCDLSHDADEGDGVEGCCRICKSKHACRGFTHMRKGCWLKTCSDVDHSQMLSVPGATGGWLK